jgi:hypothetical protein
MSVEADDYKLKSGGTSIQRLDAFFIAKILVESTYV